MSSATAASDPLSKYAYDVMRMQASHHPRKKELLHLIEIGAPVSRRVDGGREVIVVQGENKIWFIDGKTSPPKFYYKPMDDKIPPVPPGVGTPAPKLPDPKKLKMPTPPPPEEPKVVPKPEVKGASASTDDIVALVEAKGSPMSANEIFDELTSMGYAIGKSTLYSKLDDSRFVRDGIKGSYLYRLKSKPKKAAPKLVPAQTELPVEPTPKPSPAPEPVIETPVPVPPPVLVSEPKEPPALVAPKEEKKKGKPVERVADKKAMMKELSAGFSIKFYVQRIQDGVPPKDAAIRAIEDADAYVSVAVPHYGFIPLRRLLKLL